MSKFAEEIRVIEQSGMFDRQWYLDQYPDVAALDIDPIQHYLRIGAKLNRNPSTKFDTGYYILAYRDVALDGINPLLHYILWGRDEGRQPRPAQFRPSSTKTSIDVIVPVYNALEDVQLCLQSVSERRDGHNVNVIVVNDFSDNETTSWLRSYCKTRSDFQLIENESNLGFTKSVNRGLRASSSPYVIILNSDTIVTVGWLKGLLRCVSSRPNIGIAGPLSNAASWQNVPVLQAEDGTFAINELPHGIDPDTMARLVAASSQRRYPEMPFVNGFCFLIVRSVMDAIGYLDDVNFPIGYGEENDYCIRAQDAGFTLAIADDAFVFHAKSKSFGHSKRKKLSDEGSRKLREKHGEAKYRELVSKVKDTTVLDRVRKDIVAGIAQYESGGYSPYVGPLKVLFLLPVIGGGGGSHSVVQETCAMRRLGHDVKVAVKQNDHRGFIDKYPDINNPGEIFVAFTEESDLLSISSNYDIVVATINSSLQLLESIVSVHPHILPAYYIQDYEPLFYSKESTAYETARQSYTRVPNALLFAKTHWIAQKVEAEHGMVVHKVAPSIDHDVYFPRSVMGGGKIKVAAMIRPQTPVRGAPRTMRVLSRVAEELGGSVEFHLFGCEEEHALFQALETGFLYKNHGVLNRSEVAEVLGTCDVFVDFSDYQAFGRTGLEAMACACAAMVPVSGGTDEYAIDGYNSITVDTSDEDECYDRLVELVRNRHEVSRLKLNALLTASRFSTHAAAVSELALFGKAFAKHCAANPNAGKSKLVVFPALSKAGNGEYTPTGSAYVRLLYPYRQKGVFGRWDVDTILGTDLVAPDADVVIIQRDVDLPIDTLESRIIDLRASGTALIYEIDDDLLDGAGLIARGYKGDVNALQKRVRALLLSANLVTASTEGLAMKLREFNRNVVVVPNYLDEDLWGLGGERSSPLAEFARSDEVVRIGYIGTPTHDGDLNIVKDAIDSINRKYGRKVEVEVIGAFQKRTPMFGKKVALPKRSIYPIFVEWLRKRVGWDIAVIPLANDRFNQSKSNLKFLECAALEMAIVCSAVHTYDDIAQDGVNCLRASNDTDAWVKSLEQLIENKVLREKLAKRARADVAAGYTTRGNAELYLTVLDQARVGLNAGGKPTGPSRLLGSDATSGRSSASEGSDRASTVIEGDRWRAA